MVNKIIDWYLHRLQKKSRASLPSVNWKSIYNQVEQIINGNSVFLETRDNEFISINSSEMNDLNKDIIALIITPAKDGTPAWETEEPTKKIIQNIKNSTELSCILLLSRDYKTFSGYYAQIK